MKKRKIVMSPVMKVPYGVDKQEDIPLSSKLGIILLVGALAGLFVFFGSIFGALIICTQIPGCQL